MNHYALALGISALLLAGCAQQGVYLPDGTLTLAEVRNVLTADDVAKGRAGPEGPDQNLREHLLQVGFSQNQIDHGRVAVVREGYYWHNTVSGIHHDILRLALVPEGMTVEPGNIVECVQMKPCTIHRIRGKNLEEAKGRYDELPASLANVILGTASLVGPSGAATLYCVGIEKEGWQRPRTYWHKLPAGAAAPKAGQ